MLTICFFCRCLQFTIYNQKAYFYLQTLKIVCSLSHTQKSDAICSQPITQNLHGLPTIHHTVHARHCVHYADGPLCLAMPCVHRYNPSHSLCVLCGQEPPYDWQNRNLEGSRSPPFQLRRIF